MLSDRYAAATSDGQRAALIAAANYPSAVLASPLEIVDAIVVLSSAILMIGFVMLEGAFNHATAYLGMITGLLGILSLAGSGVTIILNAIFAILWIFFAGVKLYRLSQRPTPLRD